jgi:hypothetical protein
MTIDSKGRKRPRDPNQLAKFIVDKAAENERPFPEPKPRLPQQERPHPKSGGAYASASACGTSKSASSFFGVFPRVETGHIIIGSAGNGFRSSRGV